MVSNLEDIWLYDPDLEQVTIRPYSQEIDQSPALLLSGNVEKISKTYHIKKISSVEKADDAMSSNSTDTISYFVLTPKQTNNVFLQLYLGFVDKKLHEMILEDSLGQTTRFIFKNITLNTLIDDGIFEFSIPDGVDVLIDE